MPERPPPEECANCGAEIPRGAKACPECGADERTGWSETSVYDGMDLPEDPAPQPTDGRQVNGVAWYWWAVGVAVLLIFVLVVGRLA